MKLFVVALALFAAVAADVSELPSNEYLPPVSQEYLPPAVVEAEPAHTFGEDGYSYKVPEALRRRFRYRHRRDVSEISFPTNEYLPPVEQVEAAVEPEPAHVLTEEGYAYKNPLEARRRFRIRRRRDVSELATPSNEYLPPVSNEYLPPVEAEVEPAHVLTEEGYTYKNPVEARRRYRIRRRRDVSEIVNPSNEYLPPVVSEVATVEPEPAHVLTEEGYVYNNPVEARRRYRIRRRRDVSELATPSNEYLPPVSNEYLPPVEAEVEPAHVLTEEGYTYKNPVEARRRYRIRRRRDVSELATPSNEYLPPVSNEYLPPVEAEVEPAHVLTEEGYTYKNPVEARRRYRIRRRRDVSEIVNPSNEYLPPVVSEVATVEPEPAHVLTEEGYVYNNPVEARRRYRIRRRRDVSELATPSNEYLPPVSNEYLPPVEAEVEPAHVLTEEGYTYKNPVEARRRYRIRRRRDVSELATPSNEYLPPVSNEYLPPVEAEVEPAHVLTEEGYTYKNPVEARRRFRIRRRRDVSEIVNPSNEYLPPVVSEVAVVEPEPAHVLTEEGYVYNNPVEARRRYRVRRRRDVSELATPSNEYLPPVSNEYLPPVVAEPEPAHVLTEEGYSYKNPVEARRRYRIRYRH